MYNLVALNAQQQRIDCCEALVYVNFSAEITGAGRGAHDEKPGSELYRKKKKVFQAAATAAITVTQMYSD